jgi:hypothetical protein
LTVAYFGFIQYTYNKCKNIQLLVYIKVQFRSYKWLSSSFVLFLLSFGSIFFVLYFGVSFFWNLVMCFLKPSLFCFLKLISDYFWNFVRIWIAWISLGVLNGTWNAGNFRLTFFFLYLELLSFLFIWTLFCLLFQCSFAVLKRGKGKVTVTEFICFRVLGLFIWEIALLILSFWKHNTLATIWDFFLFILGAGSHTCSEFPFLLAWDNVGFPCNKRTFSQASGLGALPYMNLSFHFHSESGLASLVIFFKSCGENVPEYSCPLEWWWTALFCDSIVGCWSIVGQLSVLLYAIG